MARSWTGAITHTTNLYYWTIPSATQTLGANRWFSVLTRLHIDPPANTYARLSLKLEAAAPSVALWTGPEVLLETGREMQYLGSIPVPPGPVIGAPVDLALVLSIRSPVTDTLDVDYIQLLGSEFQRFDQLGGTIALDDLVTFDGPEDAAYLTDGTGAGDFYIYHSRGNPIMAYPGRYHVFYVRWDDQVGNSVITESFDLTMWYRKRKLTP
jgi:hypothetical protein